MRSPATLLAVTLLAGVGLASCGKSEKATGSEDAVSAPASAPVELSAKEKHELVEHLPAPYDTGDIENGRKVFLVCKSCHTTVQGGPDMTGPNLWGVIGR
ncbi:MAG TPA: cytochrome c family protein, partial [Phenylobacterium sp.]|nr:cytochrome c family protein [Phenylobacterium sp.]